MWWLGHEDVRGRRARERRGTVVHPASQTVFGGSRPVTLSVPSGYDNNTPTPLLILLHGYSVDGYLQPIYFGYDQLVNEANILFAAPDGTIDQAGNRFWNATDACCDFYHTGVDDVAYITSLITDISVQYNVDPKRVYIAGHSNGGFMAYRMACDEANLVAAIMVLAGATWLDTTMCSPSQPVSVVHLHGTADTVILYDGASSLENLGGYPGALQDIADWMPYNTCTGALQAPGTSFDIGMTVNPQQVTGCPAGIGLELWTIPGGSHIPTLDANFRAETWAWLAAHPMP